MPSESSPNRSSVASVISVLVLVGVLAGSLFLVLPGCKPKPSPLTGVPVQNPVPSDSVAVYFSKYQGNKSIVESVIRKMPAEARQEPLRYAITELLKGPDSEEKARGFYSEIPAGTQLLSLSQHRGVIGVDLSGQFSTGGGSNTMTQRLEELKHTIYAVDSERSLTISVEGKPLELLGGEGLEVPETLKRDVQ